MKINKYHKHKCILLILFIFIIILLASCHKYEEYIAEPIESVEDQTTENTPQKEDIHNYAPSQHNTNTEDSQQQDGVTENEQSKNNCTASNEQCSYIQIDIGTEQYYLFLKEDIKAFDEIDSSQLQCTDRTVTAVYYDINEIDDYQPTHNTVATIYTLPPALQNNPYINVIAAKLEYQTNISFFWSFKQMKEGNLLQKRFEALTYIYGYKCTDAQNITCIQLTEIKSDGKRFSLTDGDELGLFYEKISDSKYTNDIGASADINYGSYTIVFTYSDGAELVFTYNIDSNLIDNEYKVEPEFKEYFLNLIKGV